MLSGPLALALTLGSTVLFAGPVWAESGTPDPSADTCPPTLTVTPETGVNHGGTIVVSLSCLPANTTFTIVAKNKPIGTLTTDVNGITSGPIDLPCRVGPGTQTIVASDMVDTLSASITVINGRCLSAGGHTQPGDTAGTGTDATDLAAAGSIDPADVIIGASMDSPTNPDATPSGATTAG
jgi:hypothetical protein